MEESPKTFKEHIKNFLQYIDIERGLAITTQNDYQKGTNRFYNWLISQNKEHLKAHELTPEDIWQYRLFLSNSIDRYGNPLSKISQNHYLTILRCLLDYFTVRDVTSIPSRKITLSKVLKNTSSIKFLNIEQIKTLLDAPDTSTIIGLRDRTIFEVLFSTGLRLSELQSLDKSQFDNIWNSQDYELSIIGKGSHQRTVFFSDRAVTWIKKYLKARDDKTEALFIGHTGRRWNKNRLTSRSIERIVKSHVQNAGLPSFVSPHTFRHSHATYLLNQGADLRMVQEFLGHRNIATTQIYTHVTNKQLRDVHRNILQFG